MWKKIAAVGAVAAGTAALTAVTALGQSADPSTYGLVGLRNAHEAQRVEHKLGKKALLAWDPGSSRYRSLANYSPNRKATLYVSTANLQRALGTTATSQLVGLRNDAEARRVEARLGKKALWARDPSTGRFRSLVNYSPDRHATLYVSSTAAQQVFGTREEAELISFGAGDHRAKSSHSASKAATTTTPPASDTTTTDTSAPAAVATPAASTTSSGSDLPQLTLGSGSVLLEDAFSTLDSNWNSYIASAGSQGYPWDSNGDGGSSSANPTVDNDLEYDLPGNVATGADGLTLTAHEGATAGVLGSTPTTYSWSSGAVSTYGHFEFTGGTVDIDAKMPSTSNGMWPGLWMLPGAGATNGDDSEIDLFEGGFTSGSTDPNDDFAWHLLHGSTNAAGGVVDVGTDMSAGYNDYGLKWVPGQSITWYFNNQEVGQVTSAQASIPDEPMELIFTLQVAADSTSGWHTTTDADTPTTDEMNVREVEVTSS